MGMIFLRNKVSGAVADAYAIGGASPELVAAFLTAADGTTPGEYFRTSGSATTFGDMFTFSTSNNRTMFDSTGTLVWAPHNLYDDDMSGWSGTAATIHSSAVTAPDGVGSMSEYRESATTAFHYVSMPSAFTMVSGRKYRIGFFAKFNGRNVSLAGTSGADFSDDPVDFDLENGAILASSAVDEGIEATDEAGVYYCWAVLTSSDTGAFVYLRFLNDANTYASYAGDGIKGAYVWGFHILNAELDTAPNPDNAWTAGEYFVPNDTGASKYLSRRNAYYYDSGWTKGGLQLESAAATQLLHGTDSFATQTETVTAQAYTLHFRGTGSIALTGAHTATLNGTGANDLVSLTFTPSAGTLTLTPSGTVNYPQLEVGSIPTSYIPNTAGSGTATRAAETLSIAGADTPFNTTANTIFMKGLVTYADNNSAAETVFLRVYQDASNNMDHRISTQSGNTGLIQVRVESVNVVDTALSSTELLPGVNVPFAIATRYTSSAVQVALNGTAGTENGTIASITDMSATAFEPFNAMNGFISEIRYLGADTAEADLETVTTL